MAVSMYRSWAGLNEWAYLLHNLKSSRWFQRGQEERVCTPTLMPITILFISEKYASGTSWFCGQSVMFLAVNCLCWRQMPRCFEKYGFVTGRSPGTGISSQDLQAKYLGTTRPVASGDVPPLHNFTHTTYVLSGTQQQIEHWWTLTIQTVFVTPLWV